MNKVCKLLMVAVNEGSSIKKGQARQNNKFYNMFEQNDGTFRFEYGRVDSSSQSGIKPMSKWNSVRDSKIRKGYKDITHLFKEDDNEEESLTVDIPDKVVNSLFKDLQSYANNTIQNNYKVSSSKVTQVMIDEAQSCVDDLSFMLKSDVNVKLFNNKLLELFHIIPRKMQNVQNWLVDEQLSNFKVKERCEDLVNKEQSTLDVMAGQVIVNTNKNNKNSNKENLLDILNLEVSQAGSEDVAKIRSLLGNNSCQLKKAYKVTNKTTQNNFDKSLVDSENTKTELFWHGSRNQNWLNILSTGLLIRPSGAIHTGSMFGDGIYFADKAQKSIGYSSLRGSYWTGGNDNKGYLALFRVHVGKQKDIKRHDRSCYSLCSDKLSSEGYDSVFAHGGADLRNNEYIVYESSKCTVEYLVEIVNK